MTVLVYSKISDSVTTEAGPNFPAYWTNFNSVNFPLVGNSQSGRYVCGQFTGASYSVGYLVDCSVRPPTRVWKGPLYLGDDPDYNIATFANLMAVDDGGTVWADAQNNDGRLLEYDSTGDPTTGFTWTDANGKSNGLSAKFLFALTTSGGAIKIVMVPRGTTGHDNGYVFVGTKGTPGLTKYDTGGSWVVWQAFIDDHDDIWVAGSKTNALDTTMRLWRLTNTSSPYTSPLAVDMSFSSQGPWGYFKNGSYVGVWTNDASDLVFNVNLTDGSVNIGALGAGEVYAGWTSTPLVTVPPNPTSYFLPLASDSTRRTMVEIKPDLTDGTTWNLDQWDADDGSISGVSTNTTVGNPIYLNGQQAFVGIRSWVDPASPIGFNIEDGGFFLYDFGSGSAGGGGGDGNVDNSVVIRSWGYKLDGHTQIVWRLGPNKTLVFDRQSRMWSEYASPGRDCWRAHVGQNWLGMATTTFARNFGTDIVAGDDVTGVLWILDPTTGLDDRTTTSSDAFIRVVVGGVSASGRQSIPCNAVQMDLALGAPSLVGAGITLETSDDFGHTWNNQGAHAIVSGNYSQIIEWRSLGQIVDPGRIFRFTDSGATVRISGADMR